jgi:hypothetical protein
LRPSVADERGGPSERREKKEGGVTALGLACIYLRLIAVVWLALSLYHTLNTFSRWRLKS